MEGFWPQQASKGEFVWPKNQPTIRLFILHNYVSGGHIGITGKCVGKVTAAPGVWQEPSGKTTNGGSALLHLDTSLCLFLSPIYSFSHWASLFFVVFHPLLPPDLLCFCQRPLTSFSASPSPVYLIPPLSLSLCRFLLAMVPIFPFGMVAV